LGSQLLLQQEKFVVVMDVAMDISSQMLSIAKQRASSLDLQDMIERGGRRNY